MYLNALRPCCLLCVCPVHVEVITENVLRAAGHCGTIVPHPDGLCHCGARPFVVCVCCVCDHKTSADGSKKKRKEKKQTKKPSQTQTQLVSHLSVSAVDEICG